VVSSNSPKYFDEALQKRLEALGTENMPFSDFGLSGFLPTIITNQHQLTPREENGGIPFQGLKPPGADAPPDAG
jgi:hypothetical protein